MEKYCKLSNGKVYNSVIVNQKIYHCEMKELTFCERCCYYNNFVNYPVELELAENLLLRTQYNNNIKINKIKDKVLNKNYKVPKNSCKLIILNTENNISSTLLLNYKKIKKNNYIIFKFDKLDQFANNFLSELEVFTI